MNYGMNPSAMVVDTGSSSSNGGGLYGNPPPPQPPQSQAAEDSSATNATTTSTANDATATTATSNHGHGNHNHHQKVIPQSDVTIHDVLLGRGRGPNMHAGNQRYRQIIYANRDNYNRASNRTEQTRITREIVNHIKEQGRFLKRLETPRHVKKKKKRGEVNADVWVEVSDATARLKVGQCLRYKLRQDAEDKDDASAAGDDDEVGVGVPRLKMKANHSGGAILPSMEQQASSSQQVVSASSGLVVVEAEPIVSHFEEQQQQQCASRKFRKVQVQEEQEPALSPEELAVLKSIGRSGLVVDDDEDGDDDNNDDGDDSFDGFLESAYWEARPTTSNSFLVEDEPQGGGVPREFTMGSYYDNMFDANHTNGGGGASYDSNHAYGTDIISDAEVLSALGYPQAPAAPNSERPPVLCYCGCRIDPNDPSGRRHKCGPRGRGIYAGSNGFSRVRQKRQALLNSNNEKQAQEQVVTAAASAADNFSAVIANNSNKMFDAAASTAMSTAMTTDDSWADPVPIQSDHAPQSAPGGGGIMSAAAPFHVPDAVPTGRPRLYRPFMPLHPHQNAF